MIRKIGIGVGLALVVALFAAPVILRHVVPDGPDEARLPIEAAANLTTLALTNPTDHGFADVAVTIAPARSGPFYRCRVDAIAAHETARLPLIDCANDAGARWTPLALKLQIAIVEAWTYQGHASATLTF